MCLHFHQSSDLSKVKFQFFVPQSRLKTPRVTACSLQFTWKGSSGFAMHDGKSKVSVKQKTPTFFQWQNHLS